MELTIKLASFTGFYNGSWALDEFYRSVISEKEEQHGELEYKWEWDWKDLSAWQNHFATQYATVFFDFVRQYLRVNFTVKSVAIWSPKEYNFETDEIYCVVEMEDADGKERILRLMDKYKTKLQGFITNNHTPCDGFISHMGNTFEAWRDILSGKIQDSDVELYLSYTLVYLLMIMANVNNGQINDAIAIELEDDSEIWYPELEPATDRAREEFERLQEEEEHRTILRNQPCLPGLEEYR